MFPSKASGAQLALVRRFTRVCSIVDSKIETRSKGLGADLARVRLFTRMRSIVDGQIPILSEGFETVLALVGLFTCVCSIVRGQPTSSSKGLWAQLALERLFTGVHSIVRGQHSSCSKSSWAQLALVRLFTCVYSIVTAHHASSRKSWGAQLAFVRFIMQVSLSVLIQAVTVLKGLRTLFGTVGDQVADDVSLICGNMGAGTASEQDVPGGLQWAADIHQQSSSSPTLRGTDQIHTNRRLHLGGTGSLEVPWSLGLSTASCLNQLVELLEENVFRRNLV